MQQVILPSPFCNSAHHHQTFDLALLTFSVQSWYVGLCCTKGNLFCNRNLRIAEMEHQVAPRPMSRERPAMEGFNQALMPEMSSQSEVMST